MAKIDTIELLKLELDMRNAPEIRVKQLEQLQQIAASRIAKRGITLDLSDAGDAGLLVDFAAWLYRRRNQQGIGAMPEHLRLDLNDRLIAEKARVDDDA